MLPPDVNESRARLHGRGRGHPLRARRREERRRGRDRGDPRGARGERAASRSLFDFAARVDGAAREPARGREPREVRRLRLAAPEPRARSGRARRGARSAAPRRSAIARSGRRACSAAAAARAPRPEPLPDAPAWTDAERLEHEKEVLGFYVTGHPLGVGRAAARALHRHDVERRPRARRAARCASAGCSPALRETRTRRGAADGASRRSRTRGQLRPGDLLRAVRAARARCSKRALDRRRRRAAPMPARDRGTLEGGDPPKMLVRDALPLDRRRGEARGARCASRARGGGDARPHAGAAQPCSGATAATAR